MARITLRLPDDLRADLVARSRARGKSLNQLIVEELTQAVEQALAVTDVDRLRTALADILTSGLEVAPLDESESEIPILSHAELQTQLPRLTPTMSEMIIADREDRF